MNLNYVALGGNLTRDPELKYLSSNTPVLDFSIANNRKYKGKDGELKEEVSFIGCTAFGKTAETINQYFMKGSPIAIEGRIKTEQWENTEGKKQSKTKVIVDKFHFCGGKKKEQVQAEEVQTEMPLTPEDVPWSD